MDERACAHRTRFLSHVKIAVRQPPIAHSCLGLRQRQHFRVRGGVLEQLYLIMGTTDDLACTNNNRADRDFVGFGRFVGHAQCFTHEVFIVWRFDHRSSCTRRCLLANAFKTVLVCFAFGLFASSLS